MSSMNISGINETQISNEQFKQFEYINIHNGFMVDDIDFNRLAQSSDPNIQTLVFDCQKHFSKSIIE